MKGVLDMDRPQSSKQRNQDRPKHENQSQTLEQIKNAIRDCPDRLRITSQAPTICLPRPQTRQENAMENCLDRLRIAP